jgi:glycosyltransferase involved in cell wall biosynthesis
MNVLMISLDPTLAMDRQSVVGDSRERHIAYGKHLSHLFIVVMGAKTRNLRPQQLSHNVVVQPVSYKEPFSYIRNTYKVCLGICQSHKIDVIATQDPFATGLVGYLLKRKLGIPLAIQVHGDFLDNRYWLRENFKNPVFNFLGKWLIKRADGIRAVSSGIKQKLIHYGLPEHKIWVVPAPVFLNKFSRPSPEKVNDIRQKYSLPEGRTTLFVGHLTKAKNIANLLNAAKIITQRYADARFLVCGEGEEKEKLEHLAQELGIEDNVIFTGQIPYDELPDYYYVGDIFVLPSSHESFGLVLLEAGMAGKPVVATDLTGPRDIVVDKVTGFLVPPQRPEALAARISTLIEQPELARQLGENARRHIASNFDTEAGIKKVIDMWAGTIKLAAGGEKQP